jgi:hypothetical protein
MSIEKWLEGLIAFSTAAFKAVKAVPAYRYGDETADECAELSAARIEKREAAASRLRSMFLEYFGTPETFEGKERKDAEEALFQSF